MILTQLVFHSWLMVFLMNVFIAAYFYVYESCFPRPMLYFPIIKVDFAVLAASTMLSLITSIWDELTDEKFSKNFVIFNTKPMLLITGYVKLHIWAGY